MDYNDVTQGVDNIYWYFAGKNDMLEKLSNKYFKSGRKLKILNIGCGSGDDINLLSKFGTVYSIEYSLDTIKNCLLPMGFKNVTRADAENLSFRDNEFDCVVILDVLEHLKDDSAAMKEIYRVLKKNGIAIISVPAHQFLWSGHDKALGHVKRYSRSELRTLITKTNFSIEKLTFWNSLLFYPVAAVRIYSRLTNNEKNKSDVTSLAKPVNMPLTFLLKFENKLLRYLNSPCGISLFAVISKK